MPKLTKSVIEKQGIPEKRIQIWDSLLKGFGVRISPNGKITYILKYRVGGGRAGRQRYLTIGAHGALTCEQARVTASQLLADISQGKDPQAEKETHRQAITMNDLWDIYCNKHLPNKKPPSQAEDVRIWNKSIKPKLGRNKVEDITRQDIDNIHKQYIDKPYQGNRVYALLSKLMNLAEDWGYRKSFTNPCRHVKKFKEQSRERYLSGEEIIRLGNEINRFQTLHKMNLYIAGAIRLLLLTGARVREITTAKWEWVDWERHVINLPDSKTGKKPLFLSNAAIDVLMTLKNIPEEDANPYIIRGRKPNTHIACISKAWQRIRKAADIEDVRLHDLRHTAASIAVGQGVNLPVIGRLLGHSQASTTQRYAHVDIDPALAAANMIGDAISDALGNSDT